MQNIKSIFVGLLLGIAILLAIPVTVSLIYEDEVSQYLVEELNEYLLSEIEVDGINFSILKKFPHASLELKDVIAFSKTGYFKTINGYNTDTLFYANSIYIQLNLLDILSKKYNVSSIHFDRGIINLFIDRFGDPNYIFWDNSSKEEKEDFNLELKEVKITNSKLLFCNEATNLLLRSDVSEIDFEGNFSKENYLMKIKSDLYINEFSVENDYYLENQNVITDLNLDIVNNLIQLKKGKLSLENLKFNIDGTIEKSEKQKFDFLISGRKLNLRSFITNLPASIRNEFPNISGQKGDVTLNLNISGERIRTIRPRIDAMFLINNAQLFDENRQIRLKKIFIDGEFTNGQYNMATSSKITFKRFETNIESSNINGSFELEDLSNPIIKLDCSSELYLDEIKDLFSIDTIEILKGTTTAEIQYNGSYQELKNFRFPDLFTKEYNLNININNGEIKLKNHPLIVSDVSGHFELRNTLFADSLAFTINDNDFLINGRISKLFEYFNELEMFNVNARLYSRKINLNELAPLFQNNKSEDDLTYQFPDKLALQLRLNIDNFEIGKFNATNIKGNLNYKPGMFSLHEISFNSMNGNVKAGGVIIQKFNNDFLVKTQSKLNNININKLFYSFNNFGQEFITNQNLEGSLSGDVYFTSEWSDKLEIYKNTATSECDISLANGELIDFEPMLGLSRFIDIEELQNIKFSNLSNKITIKDEKIVIPQMDIESSAINVTASGEHKFDNNYSYNLKLLLSDLLSGKVKRSKRDKQSFDNMEEDNEGRLILYLNISGDKDDYKVKYDRKAARDVRKESIKEEREELKKILNEEFGWFKKDSAINSGISNKKDQQEFKVEFEENRESNKKKPARLSAEQAGPTGEKEKAPDQKFEIEWDEDSLDNN